MAPMINETQRRALQVGRSRFDELPLAGKSVLAMTVEAALHDAGAAAVNIVRQTPKGLSAKLPPSMRRLSI